MILLENPILSMALAFILWFGILCVVLFVTKTRKSAPKSEPLPAVSFVGAPVHFMDVSEEVSVRKVVNVQDSHIDVTGFEHLRALALEEKILLPDTAIELILETSSKLKGPEEELMTFVLDEAKATYPRRDGYISLNLAQTESLICGEAV